MNTFWQYLRYSSLQFVLLLNPINWIYNPLYYDAYNEEEMNCRGFNLKIFFFRISLLIQGPMITPEILGWNDEDDKYFNINVIDPEEMIEKELK